VRAVRAAGLKIFEKALFFALSVNALVILLSRTLEPVAGTFGLRLVCVMLAALTLPEASYRFLLPDLRKMVAFLVIVAGVPAGFLTYVYSLTPLSFVFGLLFAPLFVTLLPLFLLNPLSPPMWDGTHRPSDFAVAACLAWYEYIWSCFYAGLWALNRRLRMKITFKPDTDAPPAPRG